MTRALLDGIERRLASLRESLRQPRRLHALALALVVLSVLVRLPMVPAAQDACCAHGDSYIFFNQVYADYLDGNVYPDGHRGSGWQLLLYATLSAFGVEGGDWSAYYQPYVGEKAHAAFLAHTLSAMLAAGAVAATFLLGREVLSPGGALLAAALVALDPFHLSITTSAMSEPLFIPLFVLATLTVLKARRHPAWLLATGALMGLASMLRINGIVMLGALGVFAALFVWEGNFRRIRWRWAFATLAAFFLVSAPYLAWRADHLSGPFDYGTNQRFWADDLWDMQDAFWQSYRPDTGGPRESMGDYFASHTWRDAVERLWESVQWQVYDLFGFGKWPPLEEERGRWVGTAPDGSALTPLLTSLFLVAAFTGLRHRRELWFLPIALAVTFATFVWIYPLVRSVRYFAPLIPLFAIVAVVGWQHLAAQVKRPHVAALVLFGAYFTLYGARVVLQVPQGLQVLADPDARALVLGWGALWALVALAPTAPVLAVRARRLLGREAPGVGEP